MIRREKLQNNVFVYARGASGMHVGFNASLLGDTRAVEKLRAYVGRPLADHEIHHVDMNDERARIGLLKLLGGTKQR